MLNGMKILFQDGRFRPISSVKYERALIEIKSMIDSALILEKSISKILGYKKN